MSAKLEHNVVRMGFDGPFVEDEHLGDLAVAFPMCNQGCNSRSRTVSLPKVFLARVW